MMKNSRRITQLDIGFVLAVGVFFWACIATSHRTARTLYPGQVSGGASYLQDRPATDPFDSDVKPLQLAAVDARVGLTKGLDIGLMHTWDLSQDNENAYATAWADVKTQLTNRNNYLGQPIFSLGLMKGYLYDREAKTHITTLPVMLAIPATETFTPFFTYRYEVFSEAFVPESRESDRHMFFLGTEFSLTQPAPYKWVPRVGVGVGYFNTFEEGNDGELMFNVGISLDSPFKEKGR